MYILCLSESNKILTMILMLKYIHIFAVVGIMAFMPATSRATARASDYVSANTYNNLYPYMNNTMRTQLNPGVTPSQSGAQINVLARTKAAPNTTARSVVARTPAKTSSTARAATPTTQSTTTTRRVTPRTSTAARAATPGATAGRRTASTTGTRRVVSRSGTTVGTTYAARSNRNDSTTVSRNPTSAYLYNTNSNSTSVSSARCLADYTECMNDYCERPDMEYNRCYCSSKLAQIDAKYKPEIDRLIKEILKLQNENYWTDAEMNEYWMETIGKYTGENSWQNLEDALDIDWSTTASSVRGQQAFAMGHEYCSQHLKNCAYMQTNLRDAYRSEIARDCALYESSLQKLQNAAESIVGSYK